MGRRRRKKKKRILERDTQNDMTVPSLLTSFRDVGRV